MSFELSRNVDGKFTALDRGSDIAAFHSLAKEGLHTYGYTGISYAGNAPDIMWFHFEGDIETVNLSDIESALDVMINSFVNDSLTELKLETMAEINKFRDSWMESWFPFGGHQWDCDANGMTNIMGTNTSALLMDKLGAPWPADFVFRSRANDNVPATSQFMAMLGLSLFSFRGECYKASWIHKYMVATATSEQQVKDYDYKTGWPSRE